MPLFREHPSPKVTRMEKDHQKPSRLEGIVSTYASFSRTPITKTQRLL
jgi:hypothetical protein